MKPQTVLFYSSVKTKRLFSVQQFYRTDISILKELGFRVCLSNSFFDFFLFWKYNFSFIYFYRFGVIPALISRIYGKKVFFTGGIDFLDMPFAGKKRYFIQKCFFLICYWLSSKSIIVSTSDLSNIRQSFSNKKFTKLGFSFHVIDFPKFCFDSAIPKKKFFTTIAWMQRVENVHRKGIDKCVKLFNELLKFPEFKDAHLYIIGPKGEGSLIVEQLITTLSLQNRITMTDTISEEEKIGYLKNSKYYLQLSVYEGFGIAAIEALASGNIVIHSGRGGLKDAIGEHGIPLQDTEDHTTNAEIIRKRISDLTPEAYNLMIRNGIEHVRSNFSFPRRVQDFREILSEIIIPGSNNTTGS
jgi:glycosyltransferase involved in cell wall biosynthesis